MMTAPKTKPIDDFFDDLQIGTVDDLPENPERMLVRLHGVRVGHAGGWAYLGGLTVAFTDFQHEPEFLRYVEMQIIEKLKEQQVKFPNAVPLLIVDFYNGKQILALGSNENPADIMGEFVSAPLPEMPDRKKKAH